MLNQLRRTIRKRRVQNGKIRYLDKIYPEFEIGRGSYGGLVLRRYDDKTRIMIGKFCSFADNVQALLGGEHRADWVTTYPFTAIYPRFAHFEGHPTSKGDIVIGNDVWVGANATILSGVRISDGAIVATGAVVTRHVPPYAIVGGNPARLLRMRFENSAIAALLRIRWWDWPQKMIDEAMPELLSGEITEFVRRHDPGIDD